MSARAVHVGAEMDVRTAKIQMLDYRWNAGEQIQEVENDFILRYRLFPTEVSVVAQLGGSTVQPFGQLMFFPANVKVQTDAAKVSERIRVVLCRFDPQWLRQLWSVAPTWEIDEMLKCLDMRDVRIEQMIRRLGAELTQPGFASRLLVESLASTIAVDISRHFTNSAGMLRVRTRDGVLSPTDLNRIQDYVEGASNHCPSIDDIANECAISPAHLRRSFKKTTGRTVHHMVEEVRLKKAKSLLGDTDLPLKEVSFRLGFADSSTFSSTFRRVAGETPSGYRHRTRH